MPQANHRSYDEIMAAFGSYYDPGDGTNTMAALKAVTYFRNAVWFVEKGKVFLFDMEAKKIYDPDEYIRMNCPAKILKDIAENREWEGFCK
jgi:hypothetical protein